MKKMEASVLELEEECNRLRHTLSSHQELQSEVEVLRQELDSSLETHKKLQQVALAFEEENRNVQRKLTSELKDKSKLSATKMDLEVEVENKTMSYEQLEKKYNKLKEKADHILKLEELVRTLESEKQDAVEKTRQLERNSGKLDCKDHADPLELKMDALTTENEDLTSKLSTYLEEMEDMDSKMEILEKENMILKKKVEKMSEEEPFGSHFDHLEALEEDRQDIQTKSQIERENSRNLQIELQRLRRVVDEYKNEQCSASNNNDGLIDTSPSLAPITEHAESQDSSIASVLFENQILIEKLQKENISLTEDVSSMQEELRVLLEENSTLAKTNMELQTSKMKDGEDFESKLTTLQERFLEMEEGRKRLGQETFDRLVSAAEKEYAHMQKQREEKMENDRLREELAQVRERIGETDSLNVELKEEMSRKEGEFQKQVDMVREVFKRELHSLTNSLEEETRRKYGEKEEALELHQQTFMNRMEATIPQMRNDYEQQLMHQNCTIRDLEQQIIAMKSFYECDKSVSTTSSANYASVALDSDKCYSMDDIHSIRDDDVFRGNPLLDSNSADLIGREDSMITYDDDENVGIIGENTICGLSDREVRRISYKVAEGSWKDLAKNLPVGKERLEEVTNSSCTGHQKIYQLLSSWTSEDSNVPRGVLLGRLEDYMDSNRKDVIKFLRQMAGIETKERNTIRNKLKKFKLSTKR